MQKGFLNQQTCCEINGQLGNDADLLTFGEHVLDTHLTDDYSLVQELVDEAYECASKGMVPPETPFAIQEAGSTAEAPKEATTGFYIKREMAAEQPSAGNQTATPAARSSETNQPPGDVQREAQPSTEQAWPVEATAAPHLYSDETPAFSLEVPQAWPDCASLANMPDTAVRQVLVQFLLEAQRQAASDLHLSAGSRPFMRQYRRIHYLSEYVLTSQDAWRLNTVLLSDRKRYNFEQTQDMDYALALDASNRFRVNLMMHKNGASGTYRIIPNRIQTLEELGFAQSDAIRKLLTYHNGLVLVTGPVGSGKTATLASLIDELNRSRQDHIIAVEAPIEIVQHSHHCQITQREVGPQTATFHSALKGALRQDPDIIVIGEMRDLETIEMAISASETGHLVIGTMHTQDAATTLNRLLDVFPAAQQTQIRAMVSESLKGIICQRLLPNLNGDISLACELLLNNVAVANMIRESKSEGLVNAIETGSSEGMQLMDKSIMKLYRDNVIAQDVALANMTNRMFINQIQSTTSTAPNMADTHLPASAPKKKGFFK